MQNTIKKFVILAGLLGWGACAAQMRGGNPLPPPNLIEVTSNVYVIENANANIPELITNGGNATVIITGAGVLLIDTKTSQMHDFIIEQVKSITELPVTHVVLTHNHNDHSGGIQGMLEIGANVIVSAATYEKMNQPSFETYSGEMLLTLGETDIELYEVPGHTAGDTVTYLPQERVLIAGDLVTTSDTNTIPVIVNYEDGGSWINLVTALEKLSDFDFDYLIGGHGPVITKSEFLNFRNKVTGIMERTKTLTQEGESQATISEILLKEFQWGGGLASGNIPEMMKELQ